MGPFQEQKRIDSVVRCAKTRTILFLGIARSIHKFMSLLKSLILLVLLSLAVFVFLQIPVTPWPLDGAVYLASSYALREQMNPWDAEVLTFIAHSLGYYPETARVLGLWTPPMVQLLYLPLTYLPFEIVLKVLVSMTVALIALLVMLTRGEWQYLSSNQALVLTFLFPPFLALLFWQQITIWCLLGFVLFVVLERKRLDFGAGLALVATAFKPHVSLLAMIFIAYRIVKTRRWAILYGGVAGMGMTLGGITLIYPGWIQDYLLSWQQPPLQYQASTLFRWIHVMFFPNQAWTQFLGLVAGLFLMPWLVRFFSNMSWPTNLFFVLAISLVVAPYGWHYDQIMLWPLYMWVLDRLKAMKGIDGRASRVLIGFFIIVYYVQFFTTLGNDSLDMFWFPIVITALAFYARRRLKVMSRCGGESCYA